MARARWRIDRKVWYLQKPCWTFGTSRPMSVRENARTLIRDRLRALLNTGDIGTFVRLRRLAIEKSLNRTRYSLPQMRQTLERLGFARGRVVWVQSSWNEFYNFDAKPSDLISVMLDLLGPQGTLVMPAFPLIQDSSRILDIDVMPSATGLLTEVFRRTPGVKRSIHLTSSVCALGPEADFLTRDHHTGIFAWGPQSPYCRLAERDARLVGLGVSPLVRYLTPLHAVECLLYDEVPFFRRVFQGQTAYRWRRGAGEAGESVTLNRIGRLDWRRYNRCFPRDSYTRLRLSNLDTFGIDARTLLDRALDLGRRGVTMYDPASLPPATRAVSELL
jgi:aminoglycoside 3-N-acetyltransferase